MDARLNNEAGGTTPDHRHGARQDGQGIPLLLILDSTAPNRFAGYIEEILDVEGIVVRSVIDLAHDEITPGILAAASTVLLAAVAPSATVQQTVRDYVEGGGTLVALRPPREMADLFGLIPSESLVNKAASDCYIMLEPTHPLAGDPLARCVQFVGEADLYTPGQAQALAWIAGTRTQATSFAAVTTATAGRGRTAAFTYDLATCVVRLHQGNPANASTGVNPDADGDGRWIPNDLFVGQLDPELKYLPQADIHQDLLVRVLAWLGGDATPVPRLWYFPHAVPAIAYFNGDSDGMDREAYDAVIDMAETYGARFTVYLMEEHHGLIPPSDKAILERRGHGFGQHVILDLRTTVDAARTEVQRSLAAYAAAYGELPLTNRGHCLVWPGWTDMVEFLAAGGVRMDQNFIPRRFLQHGYLNGSGLPVKFVREDGTLLDVYEQNTHITDDGSVEPDKFLIPAGSQDEVIATALQMLDDCVSRFHGVFQASFHPQLTSTSVMWLLEALLAACQQAHIPTVNGDEWVAFNDARRQTRLTPMDSDIPAGRFTWEIVGALSVAGLSVLLPARLGTRRLADVRVDGGAIPFRDFRIRGCDYCVVVVDLAAGVRRSLTACYTLTTGHAPHA